MPYANVFEQREKSKEGMARLRTRRVLESMAHDMLRHAFEDMVAASGITAAATAMRKFPVDKFESKYLLRARVAPPGAEGHNGPESSTP